ncbi:hypothetical protein BsIDN1_62800 [Bacillus safensis]|uniref:Uncharacterized protein n=1 Tax=Bacillus safensis TaxID=561879 RepID=A0A5S9MJ38_BACIA|nr:hypothetical protein BsIDN1_62800 [Bacillus safensis]
MNISNGKISLKGIKTYNTVRVVPEKYSTKNVLQIAGKPYLGSVNFAIESGISGRLSKIFHLKTI